MSLLKRSDRFRIYRADGNRVLGIITPIENQPACSNAACHAHPASTQILGVLDTNLSLAKVDESLEQDRRRMLAYFHVALDRPGASVRGLHRERGAQLRCELLQARNRAPGQGRAGSADSQSCRMTKSAR